MKIIRLTDKQYNTLLAELDEVNDLHADEEYCTSIPIIKDIVTDEPNDMDKVYSKYQLEGESQSDTICRLLEKLLDKVEEDDNTPSLDRELTEDGYYIDIDPNPARVNLDDPDKDYYEFD